MVRLSPQQHVQAVSIARQVRAFHVAIPRDELITLDWQHGHESRTGRGCCHCHSPAKTNLTDDHGKASHKTCAEAAAWLAGDRRAPVADEPVEPIPVHSPAAPRRQPYMITDGCEVCGSTDGIAIYPTTGVRCRQHAPTASHTDRPDRKDRP
jgi:hypothetical protein